MKKQSFSSVDLIILGCIFKKSLSAHDLARLIEKKHANRLVKISTPAVYKSCKRLHADGFLVGETIKATAQPEKTIYLLNEKGKARFLVLMEHFSSQIEPFFLSYNAFLYHIENLNKKEGMKMLHNLHNELSKLNQWIAQHEKEESGNLAFSSKAILKQYRMVINTLCMWSEETMQDYRKLKKN